ncbi:hypothetical protein ACFFUB_10030 [Algimonas porphyrae]|uniref:Alpha/beta hydrolase n=1 Tax=Algimonas porphyrae TaxID=1128113 RepID=A0ABQ5V3L5_9PROT|nr:hypothetical protein [Algimonas porphyrae]GLQ21549.1 hypothetical protein GCM10007854_25040 [Algimonas porphyrae]
MALSGRALDIIIGGAGDRVFRCARRYADTLARTCPDRDIIYLPQGKRRRLKALLSTERTINLIGHSWGAADVSWAVDSARHPLGIIIGIDPVGKPGPWRACKPVSARALITVMGTGSENRLSDGNLTAKLGRRLGHDCPPVFARQDAVRIDAPYAHYDMTRMMQYAGPDGLSAQDWLLDTSLISEQSLRPTDT